MSTLPSLPTSENPIVNQLSASFKSWLISKNYNPNTVRNYLADLNKCLSSVSLTTIGDLPSTILSYADSIQSDSNFNRYFSSLNLFCRYALDQKIISANPLNSFRKKQAAAVKETPAMNVLLSEFESYLSAQGKSASTIRGYLNDIEQYLAFVTNSPQLGP